MLSVWKQIVHWNPQCSVFLSCSKRAFADAIYCKWSKIISLWHVLVHFWVVYCENLLNMGQQNAVTWKQWFNISTFRVWDPVTSTSSFPRRFVQTSLTYGAAKWPSLKKHGYREISEYEHLWQVLVSVVFFSNKVLIDSWCSISESVNHVSDHGFKWLLGICDVNWKVRMRCQVSLRLCVKYSEKVVYGSLCDMER